jgi:hypothetical protein
VIASKAFDVMRVPVNNWRSTGGWPGDMCFSLSQQPIWGRVLARHRRARGVAFADEATMATPWLTRARAVGHMRIRRTMDGEAHVAAQEREIAIGFGKGLSLFRETTNLVTNCGF